MNLLMNPLMILVLNFLNIMDLLKMEKLTVKILLTSSFMLTDELFVKDLRNLETCLSVKKPLDLSIS